MIIALLALTMVIGVQAFDDLAEQAAYLSDSSISRLTTAPSDGRSAKGNDRGSRECHLLAPFGPADPHGERRL
jgi:hypothetical protein